MYCRSGEAITSASVCRPPPELTVVAWSQERERERRGIRYRAFFKSTSTVCLRGKAGEEQFSPGERWEHRRAPDF